MTYLRIRFAVLLFALCCWGVALSGQTSAPATESPVPASVPSNCVPDSIPEITPALPAEPLAEEPSEVAPPTDRYTSMADRHLLFGRASYYSDFFDGRRTANGEIFRQMRFTAAHRTLPLGCWVEVKSIATGRKVRVKVNDRGPFSGGFVLDLSRVAAHALGVDRAPDRRVEIKVVALPGEDPPPVSHDEPTGQVATVTEIAE